MEYTIHVQNLSNKKLLLPFAHFSRSQFYFQAFVPMLFFNDSQFQLLHDLENFPDVELDSDTYDQVTIGAKSTQSETHRATYSVQDMSNGDLCDLRIQLHVAAATNQENADWNEDAKDEFAKPLAHELLFPGGVVKSNTVKLSFKTRTVLPNM